MGEIFESGMSVIKKGFDSVYQGIYERIDTLEKAVAMYPRKVLWSEAQRVVPQAMASGGVLHIDVYDFHLVMEDERNGKINEISQKCWIAVHDKKMYVRLDEGGEYKLKKCSSQGEIQDAPSWDWTSKYPNSKYLKYTLFGCGYIEWIEKEGEVLWVK